MNKIIYPLFCTSLFVLMLIYPNESLEFASNGLMIWFNKMIPTLLPFMILSGFMIRMNLTYDFIRIFSFFLKPIFRINDLGIYVIVLGFLCGFPMGAKVITELYLKNEITRKEAEYLLSFCNNIGPIYFISFVLPTLKENRIVLFLMGMYGIPIIYGLILRRFLKIDYRKEKNKQNSNIRSNEFFINLDEAIAIALESITKLGGYMIFFNVLNLYIIHLIPKQIQSYIMAILEITNGITKIGNDNPIISLTLLAFGGFSCFAQTASVIKGTDISLKKYFNHKCLVSIFTFVYFEILFSHYY